MKIVSASRVGLHRRTRHLPALLACALMLATSGVLPQHAVAQDLAVSGARAETSTAVVTGRVKSVITGQYLINARIAVAGTNQAAFTDETGRYILTNVPSGSIELVASYTGLDSGRVTVRTARGERVERDFELTSADHSGDGKDVTQLKPYVVNTSRIREGELLAVNEQRYAPNIMNVVTTAAFGDVTGGNVAEYMNFLPGVNVETDSAFSTPVSVGVRGFGSNMTGVTIDGGPMSAIGATTLGDSRSVYFEPVSINNFSRIEVTKSPTPASAADSMAGSINLVSKSSFERDKAEFRYRVALTGKSGYLSLKKTPFARGGDTHKVLPSFDFDYTLPVNEKFGVVLTGQTSWRFPFMFNQRSDFRYSISGSPDTPVTVETPYLRQVSASSTLTHELRRSLGAKADWRVTPNSVLTVRADINDYEFERNALTIDADPGATATPRSSSGSRFSHGPDFVNGAQGRGLIEPWNNNLKTFGDAKSGSITYRFDDGIWRIDGSASLSESGTIRDSAADGVFQWVRTAVYQGNYDSRVTAIYEGIGNTEPGRPDIIRALDDSGNEIDYSDPNNSMVLTARAVKTDVTDKKSTVRANARRALDSFRVPLALQVGFQQAKAERDRQHLPTDYTYNGVNGDKTITPYLSPSFPDFVSPYGDTMPVVDNSLVYEAWRNNPSLFSQTLAQERASVQNYSRGSWRLEETVTALYTQAEVKLFDNRLRALGGVRYEKTKYDGEGVLITPDGVYQTNPDGSYIRDSKGNRIRKPEAGAVNSIEEKAFTYLYRARHIERTFDGYYPSLHLSYELTKNLLTRLSYAKTYGRPDYGDVINDTSITEDDVGGLGTIVTENIGLDPWTADNYDLTLEYYSRNGGLVTAGVFVKDVKNFFGSVTKVATAADLEALDLDPNAYLGWEIRTKFNGGVAQLRGFEFDLRQSLKPLSRWLADFTVFANYTKIQLRGDEDRQGDFNSFRPLTINGGFLYNRGPFSLQARWHHRGLEQRNTVNNIAPDARLYVEPRTTLDLNFTYDFHRRLSFFANITNVFNERLIWTGRGADSPEYSWIYRNNETGASYAMGIKGTF